ncbi:MAG: hypothetical protein ACK502_02460 [Alphaproteobacteria bacterium]
MPTETNTSDIPSRDLPKDKRTGREISFGIQQTIACWATDFIDPAVGQWFQNKHGHKHHHVSAKHTWGGEIAGDSAAFFIYMGVKRLFTKPMDMFTAGVKHALNPVYEKLGRKSLEQWRKAQHLEVDDPAYQKKLEAYKEFQAENWVDSGIIATSSTAMNVLVQRKLGNHQPIHIILGGKLIGAGATIASMLGMRTAVPDATKKLDEELSERYFSKIARGVGKIFGVSPDVGAPVETPLKHNIFSLENAPLLSRAADDRKRGQFLIFLHHAYGDSNPESVADWQRFISEQKTICHAFIEVLNPNGVFSKTLSRAHHHALRDLQQQISTNIPLRLLKETAYTSIHSILLNRRDDMASYLLLLEDKDFLSDLGKLVKKPAVEGIRANVLPKDKQEELIDSLVQSRGMLGREPAVHIYANAKGQIMEHEALAEAFDPEGAAGRVLVQELQKRLPSMHAAKIEAIAKEYLLDRKHAAVLVVEALALDGALINEAVRRSEELRVQKTQPISHVKKLCNATAQPHQTQSRSV